MAGAAIPASAIASLITDAMVAVGLPKADAGKVAELMLEADLAGADAHGVFRMHVPAREVVRIATMPDVDGGVTIMTGHDATFVGGCLRG